MFAAVLFTARFNDADSLLRTLVAFAMMCLASSAVYIVNDIRDAKVDREHPKKKNRPIASGRVPVPAAAAISALCFASGLGIAFWLGEASIALLAVYFLLQVAYNLGLRSTPVADVFVIATGFVLRAVVGAAAIGVTVSGWLLLCTGALALMLGFGKRRAEWVQRGDERGKSRASLEQYSKQTLDALVTMSAASAALCYGVYSLDSPTAAKFQGLPLTIPFVFYGVCRYLYVCFSKDDGAEPEILLFKDPHIVFAILMFLAAAIAALMGVQLPFLEPARA